MARPAAAGLGLPALAQVLRHDHPESLWRARLFRLCAFGSHPQDFHLLDIGPGHRDGAELFRTARKFVRAVVVAMDGVVGAVEQVGKGWKMLMSALAAGRGISLPSLSAAAAVCTAHAAGEYALLREQFHVRIARFQAIQERL